MLLYKYTDRQHGHGLNAWPTSRWSSISILSYLHMLSTFTEGKELNIRTCRQTDVADRTPANHVHQKHKQYAHNPCAAAVHGRPWPPELLTYVSLHEHVCKRRPTWCHLVQWLGPSIVQNWSCQSNIQALPFSTDQMFSCTMQCTHGYISKHADTRTQMHKPHGLKLQTYHSMNKACCVCVLFKLCTY